MIGELSKNEIYILLRLIDLRNKRYRRLEYYEDIRLAIFNKEDVDFIKKMIDGEIEYSMIFDDGEVFNMYRRAKKDIKRTPAEISHLVLSDESFRINFFEKNGKLCKKCRLEGIPTIDHIIPTSRGGGNEDSNLQVLCKDCNCSKGNRPNEVFMEKY